MRRRERTRGNFCFWYHSGTSSGTNDHMWDIKMKETSEMSPFEKKKRKRKMTPQGLASVPLTAVKARKSRTEGKTHVEEAGSLSRQVCNDSLF